MSPATLLEQAQNALMLSIAVALPVLLVAAIVGLIVAAFQAASASMMLLYDNSLPCNCRAVVSPAGAGPAVGTR